MPDKSWLNLNCAWVVLNTAGRTHITMNYGCGTTNGALCCISFAAKMEQFSYLAARTGNVLLCTHVFSAIKVIFLSIRSFVFFTSSFVSTAVFAKRIFEIQITMMAK